MTDIQLLDAVEKYIQGEMTSQERVYFEQLRKTNPEVDQLVVEHTIFLNQLQAFGERKQVKTLFHDVHNHLFEAGEIKEQAPKAKVIDMFKKYRRLLAAAAAIASIIALSISGLVAYLTPKSNVTEIAQLKRELNAVKKTQTQTINAINNIKTDAPARPINKGKFGGTGFLIDGRGYIVTSAHVIAKADSVYVVNNKGDYFKASVVHSNDNTDVAILKIEDSRFESIKSIPYSIKKSSADLGEEIFTLGFPRSEIVYNEGYLSAKTGFNGDTVAYQMAISANPGNSGGPIFNNNGEVIGVLSGKQTTAEGVVFSSKSKNIYKAVEDANLTDANLKLPSNSEVKKLNRIQKIKKIEDCIFNVMSY